MDMQLTYDMQNKSKTQNQMSTWWDMT